MTTANASVGEVPEFGMGDRIRKARRWKQNNFTQTEIADAFRLAGWNVSDQAVGHWEAGKNDIAADRRELVAIAVALKTGLPREWILTGTVGTGGDDGIGADSHRRRGIRIGYKRRRVHRPHIVPSPAIHQGRRPLAA